MLTELAVRHVGDADKAVILRDLDNAKRHIWLCVAVKLGFWHALLWVLFGLGHPDVDKARTCCRFAMRLFQTADPHAPTHILTLVLLNPETVGRQQMELFGSCTRELVELPFVLRMACRFMFTPIVERWVERQHRLRNMASASAPHSGVVHHAFSSILGLVRELLGMEGQLEDLAVAAYKVRNVVAAV